MAERIPILPPPGLNSDSTEYAAPGVWSSGSNVRFFHGVPQALGASTSLQSGSLETYTNTNKLLAYKVAGVVNIALAGNNLWRANSTTWARTDITPGGWAMSNPAGASLAMFGDILLAVPHDVTPSSSGTLFTSTAGAAAAAVANAPDNINCMLVTPSRQVMALGCNEEVSTNYNGRCIRWSDIEDYTDWTTLSSNNAGEYILPGQEDIVGARLVGDYIVVWTKGALFMGQYVGQPGQTFVFTRIDNKGLLGREAHAELQGTVYWMSPDLFVYQWRPGGVPTRVECPCIIDVWDEIGAQSGYPTATEQVMVHAVGRHKWGEIWFLYPSAGSAAEGKFFAYCVNESVAAQRPVWFMGILATGPVLDDPLLNDVTTLGESSTVWIERGVTKVLKSVDQKGGTTYPSWDIQSSFYYIDEGQRRVQVQRYIADSHGDDTNDFNLTLQVRDYPESSATTKGPYLISTGGVDKKEDFRASGRLVSAKFSNSSPANPWRLGKPVFEVVALGNR